MGRLLCALATLGVFLTPVPLVAASDPLRTPYPPKTKGSGKEPMSGSGKAGGHVFRPSYALVNYNNVDGAYVIYLTPKAVPCSLKSLFDGYITVSIVTAGKPLIVGAPSLRKGENNFVSVSFNITSRSSYVVSPGVTLVLTRVDARRNRLWHGRLTVKAKHIEDTTVSFKGTFAARWCGRI